WDEGILEHHSADVSTWVAELAVLAKTPAARDWPNGTLESWADESLAVARQAHALARSPASSQIGAGAGEPMATPRNTRKLGQEYFDHALPIVAQRLAQAAVRLSSMLNEIFQSAETPDRTGGPSPAPRATSRGATTIGRPQEENAR